MHHRSFILLAITWGYDIIGEPLLPYKLGNKAFRHSGQPCGGLRDSAAKRPKNRVGGLFLWRICQPRGLTALGTHAGTSGTLDPATLGIVPSRVRVSPKYRDRCILAYDLHLHRYTNISTSNTDMHGLHRAPMCRSSASLSLKAYHSRQKKRMNPSS